MAVKLPIWLLAKVVLFAPIIFDQVELFVETCQIKLLLLLPTKLIAEAKVPLHIDWFDEAVPATLVGYTIKETLLVVSVEQFPFVTKAL